jgi:hypothetical protein
LLKQANNRIEINIYGLDEAKNEISYGEPGAKKKPPLK